MCPQRKRSAKKRVHKEMGPQRNWPMMKWVGATLTPHKSHAPKGKNAGYCRRQPLSLKETSPRRKGSTKKLVREKMGSWRLPPCINRTPRRAIPQRNGSAKKLVREERERATPTQHRPAHPKELAERSEASTPIDAARRDE